MNKVLAVDLDGTLFYPKKRVALVSKKNVKFLQDFIDAGNRVIFVTSRGLQFATKTATKIGRQIDFVCVNGGVVVLDGKTIFDKKMAPGHAREIFSILSTKYPALAWFLDSDKYRNLLYNTTTNWFVKQFFKWYYRFQGVYQEEYVADNDVFLKELDEGNVYRFLVYFGLGKKAEKEAKEANRYIRDQFPDLESSWIHTVVELAAKDCNKASGLEKIFAVAPAEKDNVYVIGDSGNDISMFLAYPHSFCMAHANQSVKKFAKNIISRVHHLREFLLK
jgi:Cof subfamily protein (haloacid dehalogenase superfamily)